MENTYNEEDEKVIKMLSKVYNMSEEDVKKRYIPLTNKSINTIPLFEKPIKKKKETKDEKLKRKFNFLKEVLCTSIAIPSENGTRLDYMIDDKSLREDLQFRIMTLVNDYLK